MEKAGHVHDHEPKVAVRPQPKQKPLTATFTLTSTATSTVTQIVDVDVVVHITLTCTFGAVCVSADAGTHRAATGRERRADVTLYDYTSAELLQQRGGTFRLCEPDGDDSIRRAAPFRSRLCGCQPASRQPPTMRPSLTSLASLVWLWPYGHFVLAVVLGVATALLTGSR
ncbi:MAG TPA: hypothetical protein VGQ81_08730 [Acidobacteriota bacterium]|nr:hypothetical protein [Acidobacteriota bacterium]